MSAALGITPSDHDEYFPVEALDLQPCLLVGLVSAIDALRYHAPNTVFARQPMKRRAMVNLMIVVAQTIRPTVSVPMPGGFYGLPSGSTPAHGSERVSNRSAADRSVNWSA